MLPLGSYVPELRRDFHGPENLARPVVGVSEPVVTIAPQTAVASAQIVPLLQPNHKTAPGLEMGGVWDSAGGIESIGVGLVLETFPGKRNRISCHSALVDDFPEWELD